MKPLGTITKDFPLIDEASRNEMEAAMDASTDYWNFSNILGERVCSVTSNPVLVFFALLHARNLYNIRVIDNIMKNYPDIPILKPFFFAIDESYLNIAAEIESAIDSSSNPAVRFHVLIRKYETTDQGSIEEKSAQNDIMEMLEDSWLPKVYSAYYYREFGDRLRAEGNPQDADNYGQLAIRLSKDADDKWHQVLTLYLMITLTAQYSTDPNRFLRARDYLREAREISEGLNDRANISKILNLISTTAFSQGNYSECIDCTLEAVSMMESIGGEIGLYTYNLSNVFSAVGEGENALEWAKCTFDTLGPDSFRQSYVHMVMARAYIALNRETEARQYLDSAMELILQSGLDYALAQWHQTNGRLERLMGDFDNAMAELQRAFEINQRFKRYARMRSCLHDLAVTELELFSPSKENRSDENSGPWMACLEQECANGDLPGYQAWYLLLKAELRMKQGRHEDAVQILDDVITRTDNSAARHQHKEAVKMRERLSIGAEVSEEMRR